jgi:hypothetical protein
VLRKESRSWGDRRRAARKQRSKYAKRTVMKIERVNKFIVLASVLNFKAVMEGARSSISDVPYG